MERSRKGINNQNGNKRKLTGSIMPEFKKWLKEHSVKKPG